MDCLYAKGVEMIVGLQESCAGYAKYFHLVNYLANPHFALVCSFPLVAMFNSVSAAELLLVSSIGEWLNGVMKWVLAEDRPFWWVKETQFYGKERPTLLLGSQTCETGPGSPSGHLMSASSLLSLLTVWIMSSLETAYGNNRCNYWIKRLLWAISGSIVIIIAASRMFVATHFPHQCLLGVIIGILTRKYVVNNIMCPFMKMDEDFKAKEALTPSNCSYTSLLRKRMILHVGTACLMIVSAFGLYWGFKAFGLDPLWSVKLAFKWCPSSEYLHYNTTPLYAFVESTGAILGTALCLTPSIKRFNTEPRSFIFSLCGAFVLYIAFDYWDSYIPKEDATLFYLMHFLRNALRPVLFLRALPMLAVSQYKWYSLANKRTVQNAQTDKEK